MEITYWGICWGGWGQRPEEVQAASTSPSFSLCACHTSLPLVLHCALMPCCRALVNAGLPHRMLPDPRSGYLVIRSQCTQVNPCRPTLLPRLPCEPVSPASPHPCATTPWVLWFSLPAQLQQVPVQMLAGGRSHSCCPGLSIVRQNAHRPNI